MPDSGGGGGGLSLAFGLRSFSPLEACWMERSFLQLDEDVATLGGELSGVAKAERLPVVDSAGSGEVAIDKLATLVEALVIVC